MYILLHQKELDAQNLPEGHVKELLTKYNYGHFPAYQNKPAWCIWEDMHREDLKILYEMVAMVETDSLNEVYKLTNHIEFEWWKNPEITKMYVENARSTSIGDIVCDVLENKYFMCLNYGWEEIAHPATKGNKICG